MGKKKHRRKKKKKHTSGKGAPAKKGMLGSMRGGFQNAASGTNESLNQVLSILLWVGVLVALFFVLRRYEIL